MVSPIEEENINILSVSTLKGDMFPDKVSQDHLDTLRQQITDDFKDVFPAELPNQLPPARAIEHDIRPFPDHDPPCKPHYRPSNDYLDRLKKVDKVGCSPGVEAQQSSRALIGGPLALADVASANVVLHTGSDARPVKTLAEVRGGLSSHSPSEH
jgi:hypothetical protein